MSAKDKAVECADEALAAIEDGDGELADRLLRAGEIYVSIAGIECVERRTAQRTEAALVIERRLDPDAN